MSQAWDLIGQKIVPTDQNKREAHRRIETMLNSSGTITQHHFEGIPPEEVMELWPDKLSQMTSDLLEQHKLTGKRLANGDYGFDEQAGTAVMSKIADACAGDAFARVTDRILAFGMQADQADIPDRGAELQTQTVHITVDLIDAQSVTLKRLIAFREREEKERRGADYKKLRHNYADSIRAHIDNIKNANDPRQREELNRIFKEEMARDLDELSSEIFGRKVKLALKPVIVSAAIAAGGHLLAAPGAILAGGAALKSMDGVSLSKEFASLVSEGFSYSTEQRAIMAKHPMAYMYELNRSINGRFTG